MARPQSRPPPPKAWKGVRASFHDYLQEAKGTLQSLEGPSKAQAQDAADDRLMKQIISSINRDTAEGRRWYDHWSRAQLAQYEVAVALRQKNVFRSQGPGESTRAAAEAFLPAQWRRVLSEDDILAELIVDVVATHVVDEFLTDSCELLEWQEGWQLPLRRQHSSPHLSAQAQAASAPALEQPDLPPRWRQQLWSNRSVSQSSLESPQASRTLKHFRSQRPLEPFMTRLYNFTDSQRPQRRLKAPWRDPLAPKWNYPMLAENFPEHWNRIAPPSQRVPDKTPMTPEEDEAPPGYTWLHRQTRDGQTVFPYSVASHRAFFESYKDPTLKAKAMAVVPLRMTEWS